MSAGGFLLVCAAFCGCTTTPTADLCDFVAPARGVCTRANFAGVDPSQPGCAAALREDQNYRPGLFSRLRRRSNYQPSIGVPPASQAPPVGVR
jgi:hypothetical protein